MVTIPFPQNLSLLRPQSGREPLSMPAGRALRRSARVVSRRQLLDRVETIGSLAPDASLSFLVLRLRPSGCEPQAPSAPRYPEPSLWVKCAVGCCAASFAQ